MKAEEIQELLSFIATSGLDEVKIETDNFKLAVKKSAAITYAAPLVAAPAPALPTQQAPTQAAAPATATQAESTPAAPAAKTVIVKSPMIGTFYKSSTPDTPAFVSIGSEVKEGQVVCIVEAMKLFNEIESEVSGRVIEILVENATPVEYDQPLFVLEVK